MFSTTTTLGDARTYHTTPTRYTLTLDEFEFLRIQAWQKHGIDIRFEELPFSAYANAEYAESPRQPYIITSAGKAIQRDLALRFISDKMIKEYGYSYDTMRVAVPVPGYDPKERAWAIFYENSKQFHPYVLIETVDKPFISTSFDELTREAVEKAKAFDAQYAVVVTYSCDFIALDIELWSESCPEQAKLPEIPFAPVKREAIEME
jgi:hypothetical protein